jgi:hypothetical protein
MILIPQIDGTISLKEINSESGFSSQNQTQFWVTQIGTGD